MDLHLKKSYPLLDQDILDENGLIDRKKMRSIIFDDVSKKKMLEKIIHPKVREEMFNLAINQSNDHYLIVSVPLLIETGMNTNDG